MSRSAFLCLVTWFFVHFSKQEPVFRGAWQGKMVRDLHHLLCAKVKEETAMVQRSKKKTKVLVVDDDAFVLRFVTSFFSRKEYEVLGVSSGDEALEHARRFRPDVILLDLNMPNRDGIETCTLLKADSATADIPVIILTATDNVELNQKAFGAGAHATILKEMSRERLLNLVELAVHTKKVAVPSEGVNA